MSSSHPQADAAGVMFAGIAVEGSLIEILKEGAPRRGRAGNMFNPDVVATAQLRLALSSRVADSLDAELVRRPVD